MNKIINWIFIILILISTISILFLEFQEKIKYVKQKEYLASWSAKGKCLDGSKFTGTGWTCASNVHTRKTRLRLTLGSRHCEVRVNDYGPDPIIHPDRQIVVSKRVADHLRFTKDGIKKLKVEVIK